MERYEGMLDSLRSASETATTVRSWPPALAIGQLVAWRCSNADGACTYTLTALAADSGLSPACVIRALRLLEAAGVISREVPSHGPAMITWCGCR